MEVRMCDCCGKQIIYASWYTSDKYDFCSRECQDEYTDTKQVTSYFDRPFRGETA